MKLSKEQYRQQNEEYLEGLAADETIRSLGRGVLYQVLEQGQGTVHPAPRSLVTCHYRGSTIDGKVFDDSWQRGYPEAFRVNELIEGFQLALCSMAVGDHWKVYIPWQLGYGKMSMDGIPAYSTLIFELQLCSIV